MKQIIAIVAFLAFLVPNMAHAGPDIIGEINQELQRYPWYMEIRGTLYSDELSRLNPQHVEYAIREAAAAYLHDSGQFRIPDDDSCTGKKEPQAFGGRNMCYFEQPAQAQQLLEALRTKAVRNELSKVSPWLIVNGKSGRLNMAKHFLVSSEQKCKEGDKSSCDEIPTYRGWVEKVDSLRR